jgi:hypothetical protein
MLLHKNNIKMLLARQTVVRRREIEKCTIKGQINYPPNIIQKNCTVLSIF